MNIVDVIDEEINTDLIEVIEEHERLMSATPQEVSKLHTREFFEGKREIEATRCAIFQGVYNGMNTAIEAAIDSICVKTRTKLTSEERWAVFGKAMKLGDIAAHKTYDACIEKYKCTRKKRFEIYEKKVLWGMRDE